MLVRVVEWTFNRTRVGRNWWMLRLACGHEVQRYQKPKKRVHCEVCEALWGGGDPTEELGPWLAGLVPGAALAVAAEGGKRLYPAWQFGPDGKVVPGLAEVLAVLRKAAPDGFSQAMWLRVPQPRFGGRSAVDLLAAGGLQEVLEAAEGDVERLSH